MPEETLQQLAPLESAAPLRLVVRAAGSAAVVAAVAMTALEAPQVANWGFEGAAIAVLALAWITTTLAVSPARAPFRARSHVLVLALVLGAFVLDELAQLGANTRIHDDWGLVAIPVYLWLLAAVRPALEVLAGGLVATLVVAGTAVAVSPTLAVHVTASARGAVAMASVLPMALGAAVLAARGVRSLAREPAAPGRSAIDAAVHLSVQQEQIAELEADVVPLLRRVLGAGVLRPADGARARELATGLRAALVAGLTRDWLTEAGFVVDDPDGYADRMTAGQRTAVRGTVAALPVADPASPGRARFAGQDRDAVLEIDLAVARRPARTEFLPALAVLRSVFARAAIRREPGRVLLSLELHIP